jgi:transcriptional regulator with XRE-family HTH domain
MNSEQLGKRLRTVRELFNMSQTEVAEQIGVTQTYIHRLEKGNRINSDFLINVLVFYSRYISLDRLFDEKVSIHEAMQEELKTPTGELIRNRAALVQESVNGLFENLRVEQDRLITEMKGRFNAKMNALE